MKPGHHRIVDPGRTPGPRAKTPAVAHAAATHVNGAAAQLQRQKGAQSLRSGRSGARGRVRDPPACRARAPTCTVWAGMRVIKESRSEEEHAKDLAYDPDRGSPARIAAAPHSSPPDLSLSPTRTGVAERQRLRLNELAFTPPKTDPRFARAPPALQLDGVSLTPALAGVTMACDASIGVVALTTCWRSTAAELRVMVQILVPGKHGGAKLLGAAAVRLSLCLPPPLAVVSVARVSSSSRRSTAGAGEPGSPQPEAAPFTGWDVASQEIHFGLDAMGDSGRVEFAVSAVVEVRTHGMQ